MKKFIVLIIICFIINNIINNKQVDDTKHQVLQHQGQDVQVRKLGFLANFLANFLVKFAESDKGQDLLLRIIKPINTESIQTNFVNNRFYLDTIFNIQSAHLVHSTQQCYCGSDVLVTYKVFQSNDLLIEKKEVILHLGQENMPVLENTIVGMRKAETRTAWIPYQYASDFQRYMLSDEQKRLGLKLEVTLHKIIGPEINGIKIFDDKVSTNRTLLCGEQFIGNINITSFNGKVLFNKYVNYQLGDKNYPIIFSYAGFNKSIEHFRYTITQGKYLKKINNTNFFNFKINDDELFLIEFK